MEPHDSIAAKINATPVANSSFGFVTSTGDNSAIAKIESNNKNQNSTYIDFGQSVTLNANLSNASGWLSTWQYEVPGSNDWALLSNTIANQKINSTTISVPTLACYNSYEYRLELTNSTNTSSIYSDPITINVYVPPLQIGITITKGNTFFQSQKAILKGSYHGSLTGAQLFIISGNYWLPSVCHLSGLTYTWYNTNGYVNDYTGTSDRGTFLNLSSSNNYYYGSYYLNISDSNDIVNASNGEQFSINSVNKVDFTGSNN